MTDQTDGATERPARATKDISVFSAKIRTLPKKKKKKKKSGPQNNPDLVELIYCAVSVSDRATRNATTVHA